MTHLWSSNLHTRTGSLNISTPLMTEFSLPWEIAGVMGPCLFWTLWSYPNYSVQKPTHTDLYLQWDSHHTIAAKFSEVNTLNHRARAVCSNPQLLKKEEDHLQRVLLENNTLYGL